MNIGILIPEFPTQTHAFFWREIQALRQLGARVSILSTKKPRDACPHPFASEAMQQTHYVYPPSPLAMVRRGFAKALPALRYVGSLSGGARKKMITASYLACAADLICHATHHGIEHLHVHSSADAAHIAAMARLMGGPPFSLHLHGDLEVYGEDHVQKFRDAAFVAVAAERLRDQVHLHAGVPLRRVHTMRMGVETARFARRHAPARPAGPFHIVMVSRLNHAKGHHVALPAIRRLVDRGADVRVTIAGSGPQEGAIRSLILGLGLDRHVSMPGSLSEQEVLDLLGQADAFVLSSIGRGEASPVAVMEAMAAGVPVVSTVIGGTPQMIEHEIDGMLVPQNDSEALAHALSRLYDSAELRQAISERARLRAVASFDSLVTARQFLATIRASRLEGAAAGPS